MDIEEMKENESDNLKEVSSSNLCSSPNYEILIPNLTMSLLPSIVKSDIVKNHEDKLCCTNKDIPCDVLSEIFFRLPVKSICRFRCLSKSVLGITHEESFLQRNRQTMPIILEVVSADILTIYSIDGNGLARAQKTIAFDEPQLWDVKHSRGLIAYYSDNLQLRVCNVTTEEIIELPAIHSFMNCEHFEFGFDPFSKKYKILVWMETEMSNNFASDFYIRTLEESSRWRSLSIIPRIRLLSQRSSVFSANGYVFWLISGERQIISFNLVDETFRTSELPERVPEEQSYIIEGEFSYSVFDYDGQICFVVQKTSGFPICKLVILKLWILRHIETSHWELILKDTHVPLEGIRLREMGKLNFNPQYADFSERNGEVVIAVSDEYNEYIFFYSILSQLFKRVQVRGTGCRSISVKHHMVNDLSLKEFGTVVESSVIPGFKRLSLKDPR